MRTIKGLFCTFLLMFSTHYASAAETFELAPYHALYDGWHEGRKLGKVNITLELLDSNLYQLTHHSHASFLFFSDDRKEISRFTLNESDEYLPDYYEYQRTGTGSDRSLVLDFDTSKKELVQDQQGPVAWQGELDNQLYQQYIRKLVAAGETDIRFDVINYRGEKKDYHFKVEGKETLSLPYGEVEAIRVTRIRESNRRQTYLWLAPSMNYVMVRLQQIKDGDDQLDIKLKSYQPH